MFVHRLKKSDLILESKMAELKIKIENNQIDQMQCENFILPYMQARNQEFFRAGVVSENKGTSINVFKLEHPKERPRREKFRVLFS